MDLTSPSDVRNSWLTIKPTSLSRQKRECGRYNNYIDVEHAASARLRWRHLGNSYFLTDIFGFVVSSAQITPDVYVMLNLLSAQL